MIDLNKMFSDIKAEIKRLESENERLKDFLGTVDFSELANDYGECVKANEELKKRDSVFFTYRSNGFRIGLFERSHFFYTDTREKTYNEIKAEAIEYIIANKLQ